MLRIGLTLLAFASLAFTQTQTFTYTYTGLPIPVYPDDWDTISVATLFVPRSITISNVTASVQVQFSGVGNLNVYLYSATGTRTKLLERNCSSTQNVDTTFDDAAATRFSETCPSSAGSSFKGNEPLANSKNENAYGNWRLAVENNGTNSNTGTVLGFSITIAGTPSGAPAIGSNTIVSASSFRSGTVAPGDQLAILGVNLGPVPGVRASATAALPTSLGGTTVTFDGAAAPITYASDRFVVVQAPTGLSVGSTTKIQVATASGTSAAFSVPVEATNPGLLTHDPLGTGPAKANNQDGKTNGDGSINGSDTPAAASSVISVYATGLGALTPAISAGNPPPSTPLSTVNATVTATIGGQNATVLWAGAAPGQTGVYQVNLMVPATTRSGNARIVLTAGGNPTQDNVTVQIK